LVLLVMLATIASLIRSRPSSCKPNRKCPLSTVKPTKNFELPFVTPSGTPRPQRHCQWRPPLPIQERVMLGIDARPTLEEPDDDPYLWLEDIESPRVLDWVEAQNAEILQRFNDAGVIADRDVLKAI
jgi:hypothetical protein